MICYHHNDLDGKCAAAIVLKVHNNCRMREIDYKDNPCFLEEVQGDEFVYIVDFSFPPEKLYELLEITRPENIIWIDHHETAKDYKYKSILIDMKDGSTERWPIELKGLRDFSQECKKSGAELTWEYLFSGGMPEAVRFIGDYDCWRFDTKETTNLFQQGMRACVNHPGAPIWKELLNNSGVDNIINDGITITRYRDQFCKNYRDSYGWHLVWEGYKCYAMNLYMVGSQGFGDLLEKSDVDILLSFVYQNGKWQVSMYSKNVHVGELSKKYGGGGHKGAAGFVCTELPF